MAPGQIGGLFAAAALHQRTETGPAPADLIDAQGSLKRGVEVRQQDVHLGSGHVRIVERTGEVGVGGADVDEVTPTGRRTRCQIRRRRRG